MADVDPALTDEPAALAAAARQHLRRKFLSAKIAISGANFGIAETGTLGVVESEGNGRMCLTLPDTLITIMGIEKLVPRWQDLEVFLQLLPRSSTGERMNPYTSMWTGVTPGDGPQEFHLILLDNGRTGVLADAEGRDALNCIRCSACLNVCPVYERTGGHAYGSVYPGPIGAILSPQLTGHRGQRIAAVRVVPVRRLLRRLPGQDQHPGDPGTPPCQAHRDLRGRTSRAERGGLGDDGCRVGDEQPQALDSCTAQRATRPDARPQARRDRRGAAASWQSSGPMPATLRGRPSRRSATGGPPSMGESGDGSRGGAGADRVGSSCRRRRRTFATKTSDGTYRTTSDAETPELTELLSIAWWTTGRWCGSAAPMILSPPIAAALAERGAHTVVVPAGLDRSWTADMLSGRAH